MDFSRPLLAVTPTLDGDVLTALARAEEEFSGRELARLAGRGSAEGIRRAADRLTNQGIVSRRAAGGAHLYRLNRDHLAAGAVQELASVRGRLFDRLREQIGGWEQPARLALLFGSVARGQASAVSDIDLLVVRRSDCDPDSEPWRSQILDLRKRASAWTGNDTRVLEYGEDELSAAAVEPVLEEALRDGIELAGSRRTLRRLLNAPAVR